MASGPIQYDDYVAFSEHFEWRVCVDLSLTALLCARERIGGHGVFVLGDITNLPLHDGAVDASVSLHTIYHVPAHQQEQAFREIARVARDRSVVVYAWGRSWSVFLQELPARAWKVLERVIGATRRSADVRADSDDSAARLYFSPQPRSWFMERDWPFDYEIGVWRFLTVPTLKAWAHERLGGRSLLRIIAHFEDRFPRAAGHYGRYPLITCRRRR